MGVASKIRISHTFRSSKDVTKEASFLWFKMYL
jgi:hypothetical protein